MKKTQLKDAVRNIRNRKVSYLSICLVIMLGLGGVFITRYMGAGLNAEAKKYYNDRSFKTYELISSLGITDDDLSQIKETDGITDAEGVIRAAGSLTKDKLICNVELISMTERISIPEVTEGKAPAARDECMIGEDFAAVKGLKVGDKVRIIMEDIASPVAASDEEQDEEASEEKAPEEQEEESKGKVLFEEEFTITGLMKHPDYLRRKSVDTVVLPWAAYDKEVTDGYYTHAFVKANDPEGIDLFSDKYFEETSGTKQTLEDLAETLGIDSAERAKSKAYARIDEEWQKALAELEDAQDEIDDNEAALNDELAKARKELDDAQKELDSKVGDANKRIKAGEKKIKAAEKKIRSGEKDIKDAKDTLRLIDEKLPEVKKYIEEQRKLYEGDLREALETIAMAQQLLDKFKGLDVDSEEFRIAAKELADFIVEKETTIRNVHAFFCKDEVMTIAVKLRDITGIDAVGTVSAVRSINIEHLITLADAVKNNNGDIVELIQQAQELVDSIKASLDLLDEYDGYINKYESNRSDLYKQVAQKEKELATAKRELAAAKKKLAASKKELAAEKSKYQAQIRNGWSLYYSQKSEYERKLEEAKALLAENREAAEAKLEEAKAEVEKIECKWLVFDRRANAGYVDIKSSLGAVDRAGIVFGILFMLISAIVCFSTLTIIIEEQKKMVGTVKAFGFLKHEILGKYLVFGVTAAIIGCIGGVLMALGLSGEVLKAYHNSGMYQFGLARSTVTPAATVIACLLMIVICAIATVIACSDILKSPASILMKGGTAKKNAGYRKTSSRRGGSLYSRLIIRNMLDDKVRVAISIIIIAFSTLLIGTGISMKLAYDGMSAKQVGDVYKYDIRVDLGDKVTQKDKKVIEETMARNGAEYLSASYETHIFQLGDRLDVLYVLTADPDVLDDYFAVRDPKTGNVLEIPADGVLAQKRMKESYGMGEGSVIEALNSELDTCEAEVKGIFQNYVGRVAITSPEGYRSIFGEDPVYNCYYVKAGDADIDKLQSDLLAVNEDVSFEVSSEFSKKFETVAYLYNIIVYVTTGIAILMSFMILSNLANIFLNRKKTELTVMRINGFSIKQTKGYLSKETIVTTAAGVILGVLAGAAIVPFVIKAMEQPDLQFVRTFHPVAWIAAVVLEILFSIVINSLVFRKVKDLNFRDVA